MCAERSTRAFGFGCRETPDIYNKFLEQLGFYRKHTAVDSTSLYRVVSELCYDIQVYHFKVRMECVKFMRNNRGIFAKDIKFGYDSYVNNLARPRTYGSLLELKALALRYKANVFVFEPLTHGKWYIYNPKYKTTWRIYVGRNNHFDAVYSLEYIKQAAECQSIVYQLLYKNVLGLPDVEYAVERMLHDPEGKHITYETNEEGITTASTPDGLQMPLSKRSDTQCVLIYSHLCHFHNQYNFGLIEEFFSRYGSDEGCRVYIGNYFQGKTGKPNPLLTDANISCVRQLLALGITPFPYKVAKSLDPCIYRNVEYDVWQEERLARNREELEIEKRLQNEKVAKRAQHINRLALAKKASHERACQQIVAHYIPPAIVDATAQAVGLEPLKHADVYPSTDPQHVLQSYQLQPFYIPSSDPYAVNTYSVLPSEPNHGTFAENGAHPIGVQGCIYNPFTTPPPLHFHASAQSPLTYFQQTPGMPINEPLVMGDHITIVPYALKQPMPNEYVMMVDPTLQPQQQQHQYIQHTSQPPQQQQQQHHQIQQEFQPYQQHQRPRRFQRLREQLQLQQHQQQKQQVASPFLPRRLFHSGPNTGETNNNTALALSHESNPFTTPQTASGSPFWYPL